MKTSKKNQDSFLTVDEAFSYALSVISNKLDDAGKRKIYVWRQRYKEGKLSHKKTSDILEAAGFKKVVEERWISLNEDNNESIISNLEEHFKD